MARYSDTIDYAEVPNGTEGSTSRLEQIRIKSTGEEAIRLSWWKDEGRRYIQRPLVLTSSEFTELLEAAAQKGIIRLPMRSSP